MVCSAAISAPPSRLSFSTIADCIAACPYFSRSLSTAASNRFFFSIVSGFFAVERAEKIKLRFAVIQIVRAHAYAAHGVLPRVCRGKKLVRFFGYVCRVRGFMR